MSLYRSSGRQSLFHYNLNQARPLLDMNNSTASLVSSKSSSSGFKPYICVQTSSHTHAPKHKSRTSCTFNPVLSIHRFRLLKTPKDPRPTLQERERALQKRQKELAQREATLLSKEEMNVAREQRLRSGFLELAQVKIRTACEAAREQEVEVKESKGLCRSLTKRWGRRRGGEKGWAKWEEGKFNDLQQGRAADRKSWGRLLGRR